MPVKIWSLIVLLLLLVIFSFQNTQPITVKFLFWDANASSAFLILITFVLGLAIGWITGTLKKPFKTSEKNE